MNRDVRLLFHELADLAPAERERIYTERSIEAGVRAEVESLLSFDSGDARRFTACVAGAAGEILHNSEDGEVVNCGPYRLGRLLGQGGMGAVYLGERTDGEIRQNVAIKLLAAGAHRPGWDERFLKERQLLSSLNHPSIVRVLDAGHTADGRPYLVMEHVDGIAIDRYAETIEVRERLKLFVRVCEGISHAHRRLIIHRDLKPSNILVDSAGLPKILDFGIAKLLEDTGDLTQTAERLLTPAYASPEQIRGLAQTTATDIYSLGAVLYKLLAGRSPHETETGISQAVEIAAGRKKIDPPSSLNPDLPSDLDYIVRKALRPEPEERYASVEALAGDIHAFLESRPVEARAGDAWYRTRKFLERYWIPVMATALVIVSLAVGLGLANRERALAQRRFAYVRQLAGRLFDIDVQARELPGSAKTRQLIVDTALEYLRRLGAEVHGDPELALEIGNAYMRVARVQGVPISPSLGQMDQAERSERVAQTFVDSVLAAEPRNRTAMLREAQIAHDRMILARFNARYDEAIAFARKSAAWLERFQPRKSDQAEFSSILTTYLNVADQFRSEQQYDESLRLCVNGIAAAKMFDKPLHVGTFLWVSARVYAERGELEKALGTIQQAIDILNPGPEWLTKGGQTHNYILALINKGRILGDPDSINLGRTEEAVSALNQAFQMADEFVRRDPVDHSQVGLLGEAAIPMGRALRQLDTRRALDLYDHALPRFADIGDDRHLQRDKVLLLADSSRVLARLGRFPEARRRLDAAFDLLKRLGFYPCEHIDPGSETEDAVMALAEYRADGGDLRGASEAYGELLRKIQPAESGLQPGLEDAVDLSAAYAGAAALYARADNTELAKHCESLRRALWQQWDSRLPGNAFVRRELAAAVR